MSAPCIVLVYLGDALPRYAEANLRYLRRTFAGHDVWMVCDSDTVARRALATGARVWRFEPSATLRQHVVEVVGEDPGFRDGFWVNTMLRLWALEAFAVATDESAIVHIEADVWLSPHLDVDALCRVDAGVAYPLVDAAGGAASVFLVRDAAVLRALLDSSAQRDGGGRLSDMRLLGMAQMDSGVRILPSSPSPDACFHQNVEPSLRERMSNPVPGLDGVVDAATWGQYLLGLDGRNARGGRDLFVDLPHHAIDCQSARFEVAGDGRVLLTGDFGTSQLLALHVHSKDIRMFTDYERLLRRRIAQLEGGPRSEFVLRDWWFAVSTAIRRRYRGWRSIPNR